METANCSGCWAARRTATPMTHQQPVPPAATGAHERRHGAASRQRAGTQSADYNSDLGELRKRRKTNDSSSKPTSDQIWISNPINLGSTMNRDIDNPQRPPNTMHSRTNDTPTLRRCQPSGDRNRPNYFPLRPQIDTRRRRVAILCGSWVPSPRSAAGGK